jgi:hypothetical protein
MKCPDCGNENPDGTRFCVVCGRSFSQKPGNLQPDAPPLSPYGAKPQPQFRNSPEVSLPPAENSFPPFAMVTKKYKVLRLTAACFKVLAFIYAVVAVLGSISFFVVVAANSRRSEELLIALGISVGTLLVGTILFLTYYAIAQLIYVFMDIEENTRAMRLMLSKP